MAAEEGVPVWGIEVGTREIRAARVSRRAEGGFWLLDYREEPIRSPGPEGLLAFIRRRGLTGHPLVVAMESPSTRFRSVSLSAAESGSDDPRSALMEYVHPEPEEVEIHWLPLDSGTHLVCAEERARIESYLIALERANLPAYALVSALPCVYEVVRRSGLFEGDGLVLRGGADWTDLIFLDGGSVSHFALPVGGAALAAPETGERFAGDVKRLLEYHRTRSPHDEPERIVLLGFPVSTAETISPLLPSRPLPFPGDAGPVRGKGRITLLRAMEILRSAPAAVGAAVAGAAGPRRLELAYRKLPEQLPSPPQPVGRWLAAAAFVWFAAALAFYGIHRESTRLREALAGMGPAPVRVPEATAEEVGGLLETGRRRLAFSDAVSRLAYLLPGEESAPWTTDSIEISTDPDGSYDGRVRLRLVGAARAGTDAAARVRAAVRKAERTTGIDVTVEVDGDDRVLSAGFSGEASR